MNSSANIEHIIRFRWIKVIPKNATSQRDEKRFLVRLPRDPKEEDVDGVKRDLGDRFAPKYGPIRNIYTSQRGTRVNNINQGWHCNCPNYSA